MSLPTTKSAIELDIEKLIWLIYGPPKIGKSTLLSKFASPIFATTEPGHRHLSIYNRPIIDWTDFKAFNNVELKSPLASKFKTIGVDTVSLLYAMASDFICKKKGWGHPGDLEYGKGYDVVNKEFEREMLTLCKHGKGVVFIGHSKQTEVKARNMKYTKTHADLPGGCLKVLKPMVDVIAYAGFSEKDMTRRVFITEAREDLDAGFRQDENKPSIPGTLPLSYPALVDAWNKAQGTTIRKIGSPAPVIRKIIK